MFGLLEKVVAHVTRSLRSEHSIQAATKQNTSAIESECVTLGSNLLETDFETISNVISGAEATG